ncbi:uncharacterized protein [Euwallacea similis]|uniref:uncharacterized protein n=1 Tax=Euwallacea similis TaxID=1736056 RepID=UPI00344CE14C
MLLGDEGMLRIEWTLQDLVVPTLFSFSYNEIPCKFPSQPEAYRQPLGTKSTIDTSEPESIRKFMPVTSSLITTLRLTKLTICGGDCAWLLWRSGVPTSLIAEDDVEISFPAGSCRV